MVLGKSGELATRVEELEGQLGTSKQGLKQGPQVQHDAEGLPSDNDGICVRWKEADRCKFGKPGEGCFRTTGGSHHMGLARAG
jgi:hypothetical protein